jgi:hypothetical protein
MLFSSPAAALRQASVAERPVALPPGDRRAEKCLGFSRTIGMVRSMALITGLSEPWQYMGGQRRYSEANVPSWPARSTTRQVQPDQLTTGLHSSRLRQRCAILAPGAADRKHHVTATPRRTASPLHASLSFRYTQWTSLEPQLTTPHPQPLPTRRGGSH